MALQADRKRLVVVAERLVQLGALPSAVDAEGRTALHLAAARAPPWSAGVADCMLS